MLYNVFTFTQCFQLNTDIQFRAKFDIRDDNGEGHVNSTVFVYILNISKSDHAAHATTTTFLFCFSHVSVFAKMLCQLTLPFNCHTFKLITPFLITIKVTPYFSKEDQLLTHIRKVKRIPT